MSDIILRAESVPSATSTKTAPRRRDTRTFWRLLLAIVAPLPMLCMGTVYVLKPFEGDAPLLDTAAAIGAETRSGIRAGSRPHRRWSAPGCAA